MEADLSSLNHKIQQLSAEIALLKAQQSKRPGYFNPWRPLKEAAEYLNFPSPRSLRDRIKNGYFPPDCYCIDPTSSGRTTKYLVNVERYIKQLS